MKQEFYAAKCKDDDFRMISSSGGMFLTFAKKIIECGGAVYGAIYDENFNVIHSRATDIENVKKMVGSKYAKSNIKNVYKDVETDLNNNLDVLFTGTPCQIFALKKYLKNDYNNLYTIDLICHGTPNQKFLSDYIILLEKKYKSKMIYFNMRYKDKKQYNKNKKGNYVSLSKIEPHIILAKFSNGKTYKEKGNYDLFYQLFDYFISEGCFKCPFSNTDRIGDITIGDFHEFYSKLGKFNDGNGISLIIINNQNGKKLFDSLKEKLNYSEKTKDMCLQPALVSPAKKKMNYDEFISDYNKYGFKYVTKKYSNHSFKFKIKKKLSKFELYNKILKIKKGLLK